ncbi:hypothetical protein OG921_02595 [Aldersonia sp. NBC_00410]|uniref:hypothetical protein n=1 Tax=Aldersonia sp. NBC_00410 TaxID=2975954 RepID=UPI00225244D8|nr:hypothetical protein [Aldersonia sp. NBC_00410]MCX5042083.1 hypothetical protein [Aldersonia sp. NBC_00410]
MAWLILLGVWVTVAIAVALLLGQMIHNGHRNDPPSVPDRTRGSKGVRADR